MSHRTTTVSTVEPGVFTADGMGLQLHFSLDERGDPHEIEKVLLRLDLWPKWLEIGCEHAERAADIGARLQPGLPDSLKAEYLTRELREGMVAITAFAFAFDGFYDVVKIELGEHPHAPKWRQAGKRPTPRHKQVAETLRFHLNLDPQLTAQLRMLLQQLFKFRGRAAHPSSKFVRTNYRPEFDNHVHPHFLTFSGRNAVYARAVTLELLDRLLQRARSPSKADADIGWLEKGREELDRLTARYRFGGDLNLAYDVGAPKAEDSG